MAHVMVDLETLGTRPGSIILSIGAVAFDSHGLYDRTFYEVISELSSRRAGLTADPETLAWWNRQSPEARQVLDHANDPQTKTLRIVLQEFNDFLSSSGLTVYKSADGLWGNGSDFDNVLLWHAFQPVQLIPAWKYRQNRCYRTLKNLFPRIEITRTGTYHNALSDATDQANHAVAILQELERCTIAHHQSEDHETNQ